MAYAPARVMPLSPWAWRCRSTAFARMVLSRCGKTSTAAFPCRALAAARVPAGLGRQIAREKKGALEAALGDVEKGGDILDDISEEDLKASRGADEESAEAEPFGILGEAEAEALGPLAKKMWSCARRGVRCPEVWARFSQRVLITGALINSRDIVWIYLAYARIKYRDTKVLDAVSPFLLQHIHNFTSREVVLLANAHKKLEYERLDNLHLLVNSLCDHAGEWTGRHVSLGANAVAHFYIYHPRFWRQVSTSLPKLVWTMNPLELANLVSGLARVDRRDARSLLLIARMCRKCGTRNLFSQASLSTTVNSFAKLDFNHTRLSKVFERAVVVKLDRALALGPDYRRSSLRDAENVDVFDVQALALLLHSMVCLVGTSDGVIEKLLTLISWSKDEVSDFQRRTLRNTCIVVRKQHDRLFRSLPHEVRAAMTAFEGIPSKVPAKESRWAKELRTLLKRMDVQVELKAVVDTQVLDIFLPTSNSVVLAVGPYSYYTSSTHRTAYSKLHQRLLEMEGYSCMVVPYYEWTELKTEEDKMVYLWSLGRRAAAGRSEGKVMGSEAAAPSAEPFEDLQSDLSDLGETRLRPPPAGLAEPTL